MKKSMTRNGKRNVLQKKIKKMSNLSPFCPLSCDKVYSSKQRQLTQEDERNEKSNGKN